MGSKRRVRNPGSFDPAQHPAASPLGSDPKVAAAHLADHGRHHRQHLPHDQQPRDRGRRGRQRTHHGQRRRCLGAGLRCGSGLCMNGRLPVVLPPVTGELFSSWIARHAAFYGVPALTMLRHCLPEAVSLHIADRTLSRDQAGRLAEMFSVDAKSVRRMTFANVQSSAHRFIAKEPIQRCHSCDSGTSNPGPTVRSQLQGWRITCPHCGRPLQDLAQCDRGHPLINIVPPHFVERCCLTMMQNATSKPGHHRWNLPAFC